MVSSFTCRSWLNQIEAYRLDADQLDFNQPDVEQLDVNQLVVGQLCVDQLDVDQLDVAQLGVDQLESPLSRAPAAAVAVLSPTPVLAPIPAHNHAIAMRIPSAIIVRFST